MKIKHLLGILLILIILFIVEVNYMYKLTEKKVKVIYEPVEKKNINTIFTRLDRVFTKKKINSTPLIVNNYSEENYEESRDSNSVFLKEEKQVVGKVEMFIPKKNKKGIVWADSPAYRELFKRPKKFITKSYREVMNSKADLICDSIGFNRAFSSELRSALSNSTIENVKELFKKGRYKEALKLLKNLSKNSTNVMTKAIAWSYIMKIYDNMGENKKFKAARANLAVLSTKVAQKAFPNLLRKMGEKSPEVHRAIENLISSKVVEN